MNVTYADQTWTAGATGAINFREDKVIDPSATNSLGFTTANAGINTTALVAGAITGLVRLRPR